MTRRLSKKTGLRSNWGTKINNASHKTQPLHQAVVPSKLLGPHLSSWYTKKENARHFMSKFTAPTALINLRISSVAISKNTMQKTLRFNGLSLLNNVFLFCRPRYVLSATAMASLEVDQWERPVGPIFSR